MIIFLLECMQIFQNPPKVKNVMIGADDVFVCYWNNYTHSA
jgi:hypothetical protein